MKTALNPVDEVVDAIADDLARGHDVLAEDQMPDYPAAVALHAADRAVEALRAVLRALGDLEPTPALIVNDALRAGLGVTQ